MRTFLKVESSNIAGISYNKETKEVNILFIGGAIYTYKEVSVEAFQDLYKANSIGSHLNQNFVKHYSYEKKEPAKEMVYAAIYKQGFENTENNEKYRLHVILTDFDLEREYAIIPCDEE